MNIEIANRLVGLRKKNNLSQEQLAEKIGVSRQAVSKWERSEASPDTDNLIMLARLYNVSLDELLKTEDEIPSYEDNAKQENPQTENSQAEETQKEATSGNEECDTQQDRCDNCDGSNCDSCNYYEYNDGGDKVNIGPDGIHIEDDEDYVHVGWDGIHVTEKNGDNVHIDKNGVFVNGVQKHPCEFHHHKSDKQYMSAKLMLLTTFPFALVVITAYIVTGVMLDCWNVNWLLFFAIPLFDGIVACIAKKDINKFPFPLACIAGFLCAGVFAGLWHPMWIIILTIPLFEGFISAIKHRSMYRFPYPVLTVVAFLTVGCIYGIWHPTWVIFLTIPLYYWLASCIKHIRKDKQREQVYTTYED